MDQASILIGSIRTAQLGDVWVAVSERGLVTVEFGVCREDFESSVRKQTHGGSGYVALQEARSLSEATRQISEYLEGKRQAFDLQIDWSILVSDFQRKALRAVVGDPVWGDTDLRRNCRPNRDSERAARRGTSQCDESDAAGYPLPSRDRLGWEITWLWRRRRP